MDNDNKEQEEIEEKPKETRIYDYGIFDGLDKIDIEIAMLTIQDASLSMESISKKIGISRHTVRKRLDNKDLQAVIDRLRLIPLNILLDAQSEAALTMIDHMRSDDRDLSFKACKEILTGVIPKTLDLNINSVSPIRKLLNSLTDEQIENYENE